MGLGIDLLPLVAGRMSRESLMTMYRLKWKVRCRPRDVGTHEVGITRWERTD